MNVIKLKSLIPTSLLEASQIDGMSIHEYLEKNYPVAYKLYKYGDIFYRGVRWKGMSPDIMEKDPSARIRKSKDSNNASLSFMSSDESWNGIQRRNRSLIFTNDFGIASEYGTEVCIIFPANDASISFGTESDNYNNYNMGMRQIGMEGSIPSVETVDELLYSLAQKVVPRDVYDTEDYFYSTNETDNANQLNILSHALMQISEEELENTMVTDRAISLAKYIRKMGGVIPALRSIYDPTKNEIKTVSIQNLTNLPRSVEIWTESPCAIVRQRALSNENEPENTDDE